MRPRVKLSLRNGETYYLAGYASDVQETVNKARVSGTGELIPLERDAIPTGQHVYIDPNEVAAVRDDR